MSAEGYNQSDMVEVEFHMVEVVEERFGHRRN